jgi:L-amino acid N-acyltransferase YncA
MWMSHDWRGYRPGAPFAYIESDNYASMKLFTSLGYNKVADQPWVGFDKNIWQSGHA